jgi:transcriptional regulator with XRE-family HTH domain
MFEKVSRTLIARARQGSGRPQAEAASVLSLTRGTLNAYESGKRAPSEQKTWAILAGLALGERSPGEERPCLLLSFSLAGQRLLSVGDAVLAFGSLAHVSRAADELEACELERVVVVPAWGSFVDSVLAGNSGRPGTSGRLVVFEQLGRGLEDVLAEALRELVVNVRPWFEQAIAAGQRAGSGTAA